MLKNKNGITLIALIITVILLLLLAGITISAISGKNGIFSKAQRATEEHPKAQLIEELQLEIQNIQIDKISKGKQMQREDLKELSSIGAVVELTGIPTIGEYKDYVFEVDENYKVTIGSKLKGEKPTGTADVIEDETTGVIQIKVTANTVDGNIANIEPTNGAVLKTDTSTTEKLFEVTQPGIYYFKITGSNGRITIVSATVEYTPVTEITLNKTMTIIGVQQTETLTATIMPDDATNKNLTWTSSDKSVATVENGRVTAIKAGTITITVAAQDGSGINANCTVTVPETVRLSSVAKPGDFVEYDGGNGYTGLWQVLYNDNTYGLQIISAQTVKMFTLGADTEEEAKASYNNAVYTLNSECLNYVNPLYAKAADAGRCVGSNPLSPADATTSTVTLQFKYNNTTASGCKVGDTNYEIDYNAMVTATNQNKSGIIDAGWHYWYASREAAHDSVNAYFYVRFRNAWLTNPSNYYLWGLSSSSNSYPRKQSFGLRPVVFLETDIQTSIGNGSNSNAFKLVTK